MEGFIPIFETEEKREEFINSLESKFDSFKEWDSYIKNSQSILEFKIGWYIYKNWEKVKDWSNYRIELHEKVYGKLRKTNLHSSTINRINAVLNKNVTPIESIKITYDYIDGDLSVECNNDGNWGFLDYTQTIRLGLYIEEQLNK